MKKLDYASMPHVPVDELPGWRRHGVWKCVRVFLYFVVLGVGLLVAYFMMGWK